LQINNKSSHDLFAHPLRKSIIKIGLVRQGKIIHQFDDIVMERILEDENGIAGCTLATKETESSILKGDMISGIRLNYDLIDGDKLEIEYGYYLVKNKMLKVLGLENNEDAKKYRIFKKEQILIK